MTTRHYGVDFDGVERYYCTCDECHARAFDLGFKGASIFNANMQHGPLGYAWWWWWMEHHTTQREYTPTDAVQLAMEF